MSSKKRYRYKFFVIIAARFLRMSPNEYLTALCELLALSSTYCDKPQESFEKLLGYALEKFNQYNHPKQ